MTKFQRFRQALKGRGTREVPGVLLKVYAGIGAAVWLLALIQGGVPLTMTGVSLTLLAAAGLVAVPCGLCLLMFLIEVYVRA